MCLRTVEIGDGIMALFPLGRLMLTMSVVFHAERVSRRAQAHKPPVSPAR
jgi:hypothetical protein